MATARTKTTPENNDLLDQMRKNNRAAHALETIAEDRTMFYLLRSSAIVCDHLRSSAIVCDSAIIWKQVSLRSSTIYDRRSSAIRDRLRSFAIIWKPAF